MKMDWRPNAQCLRRYFLRRAVFFFAAFLVLDEGFLARVFLDFFFMAGLVLRRFAGLVAGLLVGLRTNLTRARTVFFLAVRLVLVVIG